MEKLLNDRVPANPECYMFSFYEESVKDYLDSITITSMGVKVSVRDLINRRNLCAKGLLEFGIKPGEIVSVCMPNTIEAIVLLYAINQIGAVSNYINILKDAEYIRYCINITESKVLFAFDGIMNKIAPILDATKVEKVIFASAFESLPFPKKQIVSYMAKKSGKIPEYSNERGYLDWNAFVNLCKSSRKEIMTPEYHKNQAAFIEYTSGTTGAPKAIELTNETANQKAIDYSYNKVFNSARGERYINIIPLFVAFGIIIGAHTPMCLGLNTEQILSYKNEDLFKILKKKPESWFLTPSSYSFLINHPDFKKLDFSVTKLAGCGGDALSAGQCMIVEKKMREQGFSNNITNGFGASELGAPFCTCTWTYAKPGSVGLPYPGNEIIIFKEGTYDRLGKNEIGDICMVGKYPMNGYYKDPEATARVMITLPDGRQAIMLGDMGYVDDDGFIFIKGRKIDRLTANIGQVWPIDVESLLMGTGLVRYCCVSNSQVEGQLTAYIEIADSNKDAVIRQLTALVHESPGYEELDIVFQPVNQIPLTFSGKIDRKALRV